MASGCPWNFRIREPGAMKGRYQVQGDSVIAEQDKKPQPK